MIIMKKYLIYAFGLFLFNYSVVFAQTIPVVAANTALKLVLEDINLQFMKDTGLNLKFDFESSGVLFQKISQGIQGNNEFELFMSDDEQSILDLAKKGLVEDKGIIYATGRLVLFAPRGSPLRVDNDLIGLKNALKNAELTQFVIADPQYSFYGHTSKQVLINSGLWDNIQAHIAFAENVQQAAQAAVFGQMQGGIFAYALALSPWIKTQGNFVLIPEKMHSPLRHRMALLKNPSGTTKAFYQYLQQPKAQAIFEQYGFTVPRP
jgi:molybdate transport system substrate-binding protein